MSRLRICAFVLLAVSTGTVNAQGTSSAWPAPTVTARPWTRWWWLGSAVDSAGLTRELTTLSRAGFGGVEVTPLYGARGAEASYVPYLSPAWTALFSHTAREAHRLGMQVDLPLGSGWRTGGPLVSPADVNVSLRFAVAGVQGADTTYVATNVFSRDSVKRAAPGGEGPAMDPFSAAATSHWLRDFGARLGTLPKGAVRAYFHDSFEYTGSGSNALFDEFARRRGYDLGGEVAALAGHGNPDHVARVKADYRQTIDEMLLGNFVDSISSWARARGALFREQAHGSPGNLIDIYAHTDIPETESFGPLGGADANPLVMRFASSAAHVAGRRLVSAESFTWLGEHFSTPLGGMKRDADMLFLAGINHLVYHGTAYSPANVDWPGWQFYASMELNPRNAIWRDLPAFNAYITRVQSILQSSSPDNDVLLYWPIWDSWHDEKGLRMDFRVHLPAWLSGQPVGQAAAAMTHAGIGFDYVSDRLLTTHVTVRDGHLIASGSQYRTVVVPSAHRMPPATLDRLLRLARDGATIAIVGALPDDVPGLSDLENRRRELAKLTTSITWTDTNASAVRTAQVGRGRVLLGRDLLEVLTAAGVAPDPVTGVHGIESLRMRRGHDRSYFVVAGDSAVDEWVALAGTARAAIIMDPMSGRTGVADQRMERPGARAFRIQLRPHESQFVVLSSAALMRMPWSYSAPAGDPTPVRGNWSVTFVEGGPVMPAAFSSEQPLAWTSRGDEEADRFAGTARYVVHFDVQDAAARHALDLGVVHESARVRLNGRDLGTLLDAPFVVETGPLRRRDNVLEVEVTNLSANRVRDLDKRHVQWKIFRDINVVGIDYKPFDASAWAVRASGLEGPVRLVPISSSARALTP